MNINRRLWKLTWQPGVTCPRSCQPTRLPACNAGRSPTDEVRQRELLLARKQDLERTLRERAVDRARLVDQLERQLQAQFDDLDAVGGVDGEERLGRLEEHRRRAEDFLAKIESTTVELGERQEAGEEVVLSQDVLPIQEAGAGEEEAGTGQDDEAGREVGAVLARARQRVRAHIDQPGAYIDAALLRQHEETPVVVEEQQ